jgi:hypothetical protein
MDNYSVVLENNLIVKTSNFGDISKIRFASSGKVKSFIYQNKAYYAVYLFNSYDFMDYVDTVAFDKLVSDAKDKEKEKYNGVSTSLWKNPKEGIDITFKFYSQLTPAVFGDTIYGLLRDNTGLCFNYFTWIYNDPYAGPVNPTPAPNTLAQGFSCETFADGSVAKSFFDKFKNESFYDTSLSDKKLIGDIASLLSKVGEKTAQAFQDFVLTGVGTSDFIFITTQNGYSRNDFLSYKKGLERWLKLLKTYTVEISKLTDEKKLFIYIDIMYRHNMLSSLSVQQRIDILKVLVEQKALMNWYWVDLDIGFVHKEDLALHILRSVSNNADADIFLQKLISTSVIDYEVRSYGVTLSTYYTTLYKLLFYRMDDYAGNDNFTAFVQELQRIVLLRNNVPPGITPIYNPDQLKIKTKAQFFWRDKGPKKGRVKYDILSNDVTKIKFRESINVKTELREVYYSSSVGVPVSSGYEEIAIQVDKKEFELNHFDLVSIHFYNDPSFIDLSADVSYVETHFFTFAGFVDYLLEKEDSKVAEDVFNAALFAISLTVGFGELVAAIRTINAARAICGLAMVTSDTALYLTTRVDFRNYITTTYGSTRGNEILSNMTILSSISSLGFNLVAGSGILKVYTREQGLKLVGTGEAILKDSKIVGGANPLLNANEILALEEAIKKIKNELYAIRNLPEAVETIVNTRGAVFINKFPELKNELELLSQASKYRIYEDFGNISEDFIKQIEKTPDFFSHWAGLTQAERTNILSTYLKSSYFKSWYINKAEAIAQQWQSHPTLWFDLRKGNKYALNELGTLVDLQIQYKLDLYRSLIFEAGDARCYSGIFQGKSIDVMGRLSEDILQQGWTKSLTRAKNQFNKSIDVHINKIVNPKGGIPPLDILVIDLKGFDEFNSTIRSNIMNYIQTKYPTYLDPLHPNSQKLIILN